MISSGSIKKVIKVLLKIILGIIIFLVVLSIITAVAYRINPDAVDNVIGPMRNFPYYPDKMVDTIRFFPDYNPFAKHLEDNAPDVSQANALVQYQHNLSQNSMVVNMELPFAGNVKRSVFVYLPKGYDPSNAKDRYPVIYMLHGSPGRASDWLNVGGAKQTLDDKISNNQIMPVIAVFPDGSGGANRDTEFINSADGQQPNEDFLVKTVVDYIDSHFNTIAQPEYRAIGGLSAGGYGALNLGLKHQDIFGYILCLSGYGTIQITSLTAQYIQGSQEIIKDNSPMDYISTLSTKTTKVLLISDNLPGPFHLGESQKILNLLQSNGFQADLEIFEGKHTWEFWKKHLPDGMDWLGGFWKPSG